MGRFDLRLHLGLQSLDSTLGYTGKFVVGEGTRIDVLIGTAFVRKDGDRETPAEI
jgi:hypothetical protein